MHETLSPRRSLWIVLVAVVMLAAGGSLAGCTDTDEATPATGAPEPQTEPVVDPEQALADACRDADLSSIEQAADRFQGAQALIGDAATEAEVTGAIVGLLDAGSELFSTMATALSPLFAALADAAGNPSLADVPDTFRIAADDFSTLATDIDTAGTLTDADVARIDSVGERFDDVDAVIADDSDGGRQLRRIPACETFIRDFDAVFAGLDN